jgi:hypothetical protein
MISVRALALGLSFFAGCDSSKSPVIPTDPCQWILGAEFRGQVDALGLPEDDMQHFRGWIARMMYVDTYAGSTTVAEAISEARRAGWRITASPTDKRELAKQTAQLTGISVTDMLVLTPQCPDAKQ